MLTILVCMQKAYDDCLKPLTEQLEKLRGIPVPDYGPLDDWSADRNAQLANRKRRAAGKGVWHA